MSAQCDLAQYVIKKHALITELNGCRDEIKKMCKSDEITLPLAIEINGVVVTVTKGPYNDAPPQTKVLPLHKGCQT